MKNSVFSLRYLKIIVVGEKERGSMGSITSLWPKESPSGVSGNAGLTLSSERDSSQIIVQSREQLLGRIHPDDPVWKSCVETLSEVHIPQGWVLLQEEGPLPKLVPCVRGSRLCSSPPKTS